MNPLGVTITIPESAAIRLYGLHMLLASHHFCFDGETELQDGIESLLNESKISFEREFRLNEQDRPDFFLKSESSNLVIEVKIHDPLAKVTRQLHRYAQHDAVHAMLLVTTRHTHRDVPREINGKPISILLIGGFGL